MYLRIGFFLLALPPLMAAATPESLTTRFPILQQIAERKCVDCTKVTAEQTANLIQEIPLTKDSKNPLTSSLLFILLVNNNHAPYRDVIIALGKDADASPLAQINLATLYNKEGNQAERLHFLRLAVTKKDPWAQNNLGVYYYSQKEEKLAAHYYTLAAEQGCADALYSLCDMNKDNMEKAMDYLNRAAEAGHPIAKEMLSKLS